MRDPYVAARLNLVRHRRPLDVADGVVIGIAASGALWIGVLILIGI